METDIVKSYHFTVIKYKQFTRLKIAFQKNMNLNWTTPPESHENFKEFILWMKYIRYASFNIWCVFTRNRLQFAHGLLSIAHFPATIPRAIHSPSSLVVLHCNCIETNDESNWRHKVCVTHSLILYIVYMFVFYCRKQNVYSVYVHLTRANAANIKRVRAVG